MRAILLDRDGLRPDEPERIDTLSPSLQRSASLPSNRPLLGEPELVPPGLAPALAQGRRAEGGADSELRPLLPVSRQARRTRPRFRSVRASPTTFSRRRSPRAPARAKPDLARIAVLRARAADEPSKAREELGLERRDREVAAVRVLRDRQASPPVSICRIGSPPRRCATRS